MAFMGIACKKHKRYAAKRRPISNCEYCLEIWFLKKDIDYYDEQKKLVIEEDPKYLLADYPEGIVEVNNE